ncbi:hypothetical protein CR513_60170, partial [Mucuna pruriens]
METQLYFYRVSRYGLEHDTRLMSNDVFKLRIRVSFHSSQATSRILLQHCASISSYNFIQEGQDFLATLLSRTYLSIGTVNEIAEGIISNIRAKY